MRIMLMQLQGGTLFLSGAPRAGQVETPALAESAKQPASLDARVKAKAAIFLILIDFVFVGRRASDRKPCQVAD